MRLNLDFKKIMVVAPLVATLAVSGCSKADNQTVPTTKANVSGSLSIEGGANSPFALALNKKLSVAKNTIHVETVTPTDTPALYWVTFDQMPGTYVSSDAAYLIQGSVLSLKSDGIADMKNSFMKSKIAKDLAGLSINDMVVFAPKTISKKVVYVFTDVDCGYCRKFHSEIDNINAHGIEVRYLAWPRSEQSEPAMEAVWCSADRKAALTAAKHGLLVNTAPCANPVRKQQALGMSFGVQGTPAVYSAEGEQLGGYIPAEELAKKLGL